MNRLFALHDTLNRANSDVVVTTTVLPEAPFLIATRSRLKLSVLISELTVQICQEHVLDSDWHLTTIVGADSALIV